MAMRRAGQLWWQCIEQTHHDLLPPPLSSSRILQTYTALKAAVLVDDGAVIYLNGAEIGRLNMPAGTLGISTLAAGAIDGDDEGGYTELDLDPAELTCR